MRTLIVFSAVLTVAACGMCGLPPTDQAAEVEQGHWRRTARGWEDRRQWDVAPPPIQPVTQVHPALVGTFQLLVSLGALAAFPATKSKGRVCDA